MVLYHTIYGPNSDKTRKYTTKQLLMLLLLKLHVAHIYIIQFTTTTFVLYRLLTVNDYPTSFLMKLFLSRKHPKICNKIDPLWMQYIRNTLKFNAVFHGIGYFFKKNQHSLLKFNYQLNEILYHLNFKSNREFLQKHNSCPRLCIGFPGLSPKLLRLLQY